LRNNDHRPRRVVDEVMAEAAQDELGQTTSPSTPDDDRVGVFAVGQPEQPTRATVRR
jgi:hypothetical protein